MKDKMFGRLVALLMVLVMIVPTMSAVYADEADTSADNTSATVTDTSAQGLDDANRAYTYSTFYDRHINDPRPDKEYVIDYSSYIDADEEGGFYVDTIDGVECLVWPNSSGTVSFPVTVTEEGVYCIEINYYALEGTANDMELSVKIDGESQYDTSERIVLDKVWTDNENSYTVETDENGVETKAFKEDYNGNQIRPTLQEYLTWQTVSFEDTDGLFNDPLGFYFTEGEHVITIESDKAKFAIASLRIYNPTEIASATDAANVTTDEAKASETTGVYVCIEGEASTYRSDITLYATYDRSTYLTSPSDPVKMVYNTVGSETWKESGQYITWTFNMEKAGWVKIGIRGKQDQMRGLYSNRALYIDGEIPCAEAEQIKFYYSTSWDLTTVADDNGNTLYFWLDEGEHEITLKAIPGEIGDIMRRLDDIVYELNKYYRQILQITGPSPDEYNTYSIHVKIPTILDDYQLYADELREIKAEIEALAGTEGTEAVALETMAKLLERCIKRPDDIPNTLGQLKDDISSLSQWMTDYRSQYLEIDMIEITSADVEFTSVKENFWEGLKFSFNAFIGSFFNDYNVLSQENEEALNVWVSLGRDQAQIVKEMVDSYFVPETGIQVSINLVQGGILEATLAGKGPDVAFFIGGDFPIQLAARDCLVDLSEFDDYEEVITRFSDNIMTLYTYHAGENEIICGLPITQNYSMMFYRTDVLASFGFDNPPETWDELIEMLPVLQRSYMGIGFNCDTFGTLMVQNDMTYYNDTLTATRFDEQTAVECFEMWTKFYTTYSFEQTFDQFTRFRTGEYPIIITGYTFYNQLYTAAPEIRGLWDFALMPGTVQEDGSISHATTSSSAGAIIFSKLNETQRQNAWELIKWFTSTDIQSEYGRSIEALLGPLGRYDTANTEALRQLAWSKSEVDLIIEAQSYTVDFDIIPATYIVGRNITNAFRETVNNAKNPRDTLLWYNRDINDEITRKYEELGIDMTSSSN